jgi:hypothetical protein
VVFAREFTLYFDWSGIAIVFGREGRSRPERLAALLSFGVPAKPNLYASD